MEPSIVQIADKPSSPDQAVSLVIPCKPEYVSLCRLVVGALGGAEGLDEEVVADIKVAVTEACNCFLGPIAESVAFGESSDPAFLQLDFEVTPEIWVIRVSSACSRVFARRGGICRPEGEAGLGLTIMRALLDSVEETITEGQGPVLRLVKRVGESPEPSE